MSDDSTTKQTQITKPDAPATPAEPNPRARTLSDSDFDRFKQIEDASAAHVVSMVQPRFGWPAAVVELGYFIALCVLVYLQAAHDILLALLGLYVVVRGGALAMRRTALKGD